MTCKYDLLPRQAGCYLLLNTHWRVFNHLTFIHNKFSPLIHLTLNLDFCTQLIRWEDAVSNSSSSAFTTAAVWDSALHLHTKFQNMPHLQLGVIHTADSRKGNLLMSLQCCATTLFSQHFLQQFFQTAYHTTPTCSHSSDIFLPLSFHTCTLHSPGV